MKAGNMFRWLHFSDLHVGQGGQARIWPRASTMLLDDLETAFNKTGGFDCLIFSGDLVQTGSTSEFEEFDKILEGILGRLRNLGTSPPVITVPGNHDLSRPERLNSSALAFTQFWNEPELREVMWKTNSEYLEFLDKTFQNYSDWRNRAIKNGFHLTPTTQGLLPGDASYLLNTEVGRVGVIGLNSTWLQLGAGDYNGQLHVDAKQLLSITAQAPDNWVRANNVNLLLTHQPSTWLHTDSPASWDADLNPPGRFDLHLFGHMHDPSISSVAHGGGLPRRNVQAASLFGLETYGNGSTRIQGYSANSITIDSVTRRFDSWPRRLVSVVGGRMKIVPDMSQEINESTGALSIDYSVERRTLPENGDKLIKLDLFKEQGDRRLVPVNFDLEVIRHVISESKGHLNVRRVEQDACIAALLNSKIVWIISDWGMGGDGFVASICARIELSREKVFSVDFSDYDAREDFLDGLRVRIGGSFQAMCDALVEAGKCVLIIDNVDAGTSGVIDRALEDLLGPVRDFTDDALIIIRSRRRPKGVDAQIIELKALDEPDVAIYAGESELGSERYSKPDAVSKLFRCTDGVPSRLDDTLRDLEIISLSDLLSADPDYGNAAGIPSTAPPALVASVAELALSSDRAEERAYQLLLALSGLPQGEQLGRLTRFLGPHPFYPAHARALVERSLIETITLAALDGLPRDDTQKALIVRRPVRDYIRSIMDAEMARRFDRKAIDLYFGDSWATGEVKTSPTGKRVRQALCDSYEVNNAAALILRSIRRAILETNKLETDQFIRLATAFVALLIAGDHFRAAASLSEDVITVLEEFGGFTSETNLLRYEYARSLRMCSRTTEAQAEFQKLNLEALSNSQRQHAELELALTLQRLKDERGAIDAANRAIDLDPRSAPALQARVLLAEQITDITERSTELRRLLVISARKNYNTISSNIRLTLAEDERDNDKAYALLNLVHTSSKSDDFYNGVRAIVQSAERQSRSSSLGEADRSRLINAYQFLYSERMITIFDRCHEVLWNEFERLGEVGNLLNLFRHSSFIWRLSGKLETEARYLAKLFTAAKGLSPLGNFLTSRDGAYFVVRVSLVIKGLEDTTKRIQSS